jgi:hypothetical protein
MKKNLVTNSILAGILSLMIVILLIGSQDVLATSQWSRATGQPCSTCHTVFPRLNTAGEDYLRSGYQLMSAHGDEDYKEPAFLEKLENMFGFRLNMTPIQLETKAFLEDSSEEKGTRVTLGNPVWLQMFVAGSVYRDISFFSELEYSSSSFKFNWFYFNFTNLAKSPALNLQVGNISPLEFASFPNRLPQFPALKAEGMLKKSSDGKGEESVDMSSARPGLQYYGYGDWILAYAGVSPGTKATDVNQYLHYWGGLVFRLPANAVKGFEGSNATIHVYKGTDTKYTGFTASSTVTVDTLQRKNDFVRFSPQVNVRYLDKLDIQAAYISAKDDNWTLAAPGAEKEWKYSGIGLEAGYMPNMRWHLGLHYDYYSSDSTIAIGTYAGEPIWQYQRIVPGITYIINQNLRFTAYFEKDLSDDRGTDLSDKLYLNMRAMF